MVIIKRERGDTAKLHEEYNLAVEKVQEYLEYVKRTVDRKTVDISVLNSQIEALSKKKLSDEETLQAREDEFRISHEKKAEQIISEATEKAQKKGFFYLDSMGFPVENSKIQSQQYEYEYNESYPEQDLLIYHFYFHGINNATCAPRHH